MRINTTDMNRYLLQPSHDNEGWFVATDTKYDVVCKFKAHEYNETQKFTVLDDSKLAGLKPNEVAAIASGIGDWLAAFHYNLCMPPVDLDERHRIGMMLRYCRTKAGYDLRTLAELSGVSHNNIWKIENGKYNVSIDILAKILKPLGVSLTID